MQFLVILGGFFLWGLLFAACFWGGPAIIKSIQKSQKKSWGKGTGDPAQEIWTFRFYVICFFAGIPILLLIALFQT